MKYFTKLDDGLWQDNQTGVIGPLRKGRGKGWYVEDEERIPKQIKRKGYSNEDYQKQEDRIAELRKEYDSLVREEEDYAKDWDGWKEPSYELESVAYDRINKEDELVEERQKYDRMLQSPYVERKMKLGRDKLNSLKESNQVAKAEEDLKSLYTYQDEKSMGTLKEEPFKDYEDKYGKKVVNKAWKNLNEKYDIQKGAYTDSEGLTYNNLIDKSYIGLKEGENYVNSQGTIINIKSIDDKGQVVHSFQTSPTTPPSYRTFMEDDVRSMLDHNGYVKVGKEAKAREIDKFNNSHDNQIAETVYKQSVGDKKEFLRKMRQDYGWDNEDAKEQYYRIDKLGIVTDKNGQVIDRNGNKTGVYSTYNYDTEYKKEKPSFREQMTKADTWEDIHKSIDSIDNNYIKDNLKRTAQKLEEGENDPWKSASYLDKEYIFNENEYNRDKKIVNKDISPMSEYSDTTGTGLSDKQSTSLSKMSLSELRNMANEYDINTKGKSKKQLLSALISMFNK